MKINPVIFREYDIRGVVGEDFDTNSAKELGKAIATFTQRKFNARPVITIGHDARNSSPEISQALIEGITEIGGKTILLGLVTTPISYFSTFG